jgi:MFS family permease
LVRQNLRIIVLAVGVLAAGTIATYVLNYMTTFAQGTLHMKPGESFLAAALGNIAGIGAGLWGGWLSDRIGRRPVMIWANLGSLLIVLPVFYWIIETRSAVALVIGSTLLGFASSVKNGAFYVAFAETLPKRVRAGVLATVYALSIAVFGGTTQLVLTWLIHATGSPSAPGWYLAAATLVGQISLMLILESAPAKAAASRASVTRAS